jgi:hypothetical protein
MTTPPTDHDAATQLAETLRGAGVEVGSVGGQHFREVVATRLLRAGYRLAAQPERTGAQPGAGVAAVLAEVMREHGHPGEILAVLGDAWMVCGCGLKIDADVEDGMVKIKRLNQTWALHVGNAQAAALAAAGQGTTQPAPSVGGMSEWVLSEPAPAPDAALAEAWSMGYEAGDVDANRVRDIGLGYAVTGSEAVNPFGAVVAAALPDQPTTQGEGVRRG